jgi:N-succinyldiaminopimelate aminotransferase
MRERRDLLCEGLSALGFEVFRPRGTYFVTTDIRPLGLDDGVEFCRMLPESCGVVAIPHQVFYDNVEVGRPLVRWAFCKRPELLSEALTRLARLRGQGSAPRLVRPPDRATRAGARAPSS